MSILSKFQSIGQKLVKPLISVLFIFLLYCQIHTTAFSAVSGFRQNDPVFRQVRVDLWQNGIIKQKENSLLKKINAIEGSINQFQNPHGAECKKRMKDNQIKDLINESK